jgi:hypothetical protein
MRQTEIISGTIAINGFLSFVIFRVQKRFWSLPSPSLFFHTHDVWQLTQTGERQKAGRRDNPRSCRWRTNC